MGEWAVNIHIIHTFNMQAAYDDLMLVGRSPQICTVYHGVTF